MYALIFLLNSVVAGILAWSALRHRGFAGAGPFAGMMLACTIWSFGRAFEAISGDMPTKILWAKVEYWGIATIGTFWFLFAFAYGGQEKKISRWLMAALWVIPLATLGIVFTNESHHWVWSRIVPSQRNAQVLVYGHGPWFWVMAAQNYGMILSGMVLLFRQALFTSRFYYSRFVMLIAGASLPLVANLIYLLGLSPWEGVDLTPFSFTFSGLLFGISALRFHLFDISPLARNILVENLNVGVLSVDMHNRIVDLNPAAQRSLGLSTNAMGKPLETVFADWTEFLASFGQPHPQPAKAEFRHHRDQILAVEAVPLQDRQKHDLGRLLIFQDVTMQRQLDQQLRQLSRAVEQSPATVIITDLNGHIVYVNPKFTELTGYSVDEVLGKNPNILKSGHTPPEEYRRLWETITTGGEWRGEFLNKKKNGELYWELAVISGVKDASGRITHYVGVKEDITARKLAEQAEREQRAFAEALGDTSNVLISTLELDQVLDRIMENIGRVVSHDGTAILLIEDNLVHFARLRGFQQHGGDEAQMLTMKLPVTSFHYWQQMFQTRLPIVIPDTQIDPHWQKTPYSTWIRSYISAPLLVKDQVIGFLDLNSTSPDFYSQQHIKRLQAFANAAALAIQNARLYAEVQRLSLTDELTGLYNYRGLILLGRHEFDRARRFGRRLAALFLDVDHFRDFNNLYSHATGNEMLQAVAQQIRQSTRNVDLAARFGGEEFVVLLPETDLETARQVAERLRHHVQLQQVLTKKHGPLAVTISIGCAEMDNNMTDLDALLNRANQAEHRAKERGRNRVEVAE